jgi:hypothetical protein
VINEKGTNNPIGFCLCFTDTVTAGFYIYRPVTIEIDGNNNKITINHRNDMQEPLTWVFAVQGSMGTF